MLHKLDTRVYNALRVLGRCTPAYLTEVLKVDGAYLRQRLKYLLDNGFIIKKHRGMYELNAEKKLPFDFDTLVDLDTMSEEESLKVGFSLTDFGLKLYEKGEKR